MTAAFSIDRVGSAPRSQPIRNLRKNRANLAGWRGPCKIATPTAWLLIILGLASGCQPKSGVDSRPAATTPATSPAPQPTIPSPDEANASGSTAGAAPKVSSVVPRVFQRDKVELRDDAGNEIASWKSKESDSVKYYDGQGTELAKFTLSEGRLKAKSPDDRPLFELKRKDDKVMLKDASGDVELFKFKLKGEDLDFYAPGDRRLYRIRKKDYGYALEDNADQTLFRAKSKDGKLVLRDPSDETVVASKDLADPLCLVFLRIAELDPVQQAACVVYFHSHEAMWAEAR